MVSRRLPNLDNENSWVVRCFPRLPIDFALSRCFNKLFIAAENSDDSGAHKNPVFSCSMLSVGPPLFTAIMGCGIY